MRVLCDKGVFLLISFGTPQTREGYLKYAHLDWDVKITELPARYDDQHQKAKHFVYLCRKKGAENSKAALSRWPHFQAALEAQLAKRQVSEGNRSKMICAEKEAQTLEAAAVVARATAVAAEATAASVKLVAADAGAL